MEKILISACLIGEKVRYHGGDAKVESSVLAKWNDEGRLVSLCPEVSAGMPAPRPPSEIGSGSDGLLVIEGKAGITNRDGTNVTESYVEGARRALALALSHSIRIAILKDGSPSCGSSQIYDGTFSGNKKAGSGVTTALLRANGIKVFSENEIEWAAKYLNSLR